MSFLWHFRILLGIGNGFMRFVLATTPFGACCKVFTGSEDHRVGRIFHFLLDPGAHKYPPGYGDLRDFFSGMEIFLSQPKREPD